MNEKKKIRIRVTDVAPFVDFIASRSDKSKVVIKTSKSMQVTTKKYGKRSKGGHMGRTLVAEISRMKAHIKKNIKEGLADIPEFTDRDEIKYIGYSKLLHERDYEGAVCSIDLTAAYYFIAIEAGLIQQKYADYIFKRFQKINRLKILGAIASVKRVAVYDQHGLMIDEDEVKDEQLRNVWFAICKRCDAVFRELFDNPKISDKMLFYYVDSISFIIEDGADYLINLVENEFINKGLPSKLKLGYAKTSTKKWGKEIKVRYESKNKRYCFPRNKAVETKTMGIL